MDNTLQRFFFCHNGSLRPPFFACVGTCCPAGPVSCSGGCSFPTNTDVLRERPPVRFQLLFKRSHFGCLGVPYQVFETHDGQCVFPDGGVVRLEEFVRLVTGRRCGVVPVQAHNQFDPLFDVVSMGDGENHVVAVESSGEEEDDSLLPGPSFISIVAMLAIIVYRRKR